MKINERGYWENPTNEGHGHDEGLANALVEFFKAQKKDYPVLFVWDVGCGDGFYTKYLNKNDDIQVIGTDGNPHTIELAGPNAIVSDLSKDVFLPAKDWVLCLEVGEHIPEQYQKTFIGNIDRLNKNGIVLSWAIRGQGGDGHVNCLDNYEVIKILESMGYKWDIGDSMKLRLACAEYPTPCYWFRNTIMIFRRVK